MSLQVPLEEGVACEVEADSVEEKLPQLGHPSPPSAILGSTSFVFFNGKLDVGVEKLGRLGGGVEAFEPATRAAEL